MDKPKREAILDLSKYVNERIRVKFTGGREGALSFQIVVKLEAIHDFSVTGILKGYDQLLNLVLDEVEEEILGKSANRTAKAQIYRQLQSQSPASVL